MIPLMKSAFLEERSTKEALARFILKTDRLSMDVQCLEFERRFAAYQGRRHAVLFNSGGSANLALIQALKNLDHLKHGAKVGFSALTWSTNVMPLFQLGLEPLAVDCDPEVLNSTSEQLATTLGQTHLDAFFITNAMGLAGDLVEIKRVCDEKEILLIEDNCEALGTEVSGVKTGNFGLASTFSFFVAHHMSTIEGGMVCTDDEGLAVMLALVRANGWDRNLPAQEQFRLRSEHSVPDEFEGKYTFYDLGFNFRPTEITGFLGLQQIEYLDANIEKRQANHCWLETFVQENPELVTIRHDHLDVFSSFAFPVLATNPSNRAKYVSKFARSGIEVRPMIAGNIERQPFYRKYGSVFTDLPGADQVHATGFYCGNYPELTEIDLNTIALALNP